MVIVMDELLRNLHFHCSQQMDSLVLSCNKRCHLNVNVLCAVVEEDG